ncbi:hypothetical protein Y032_0080g1378 [Ancylostoma ceylanicum]|uniref:Uncharacterized protein n=1 Tax=Ancylostoma ceylanicum TaxID=53326 RepID=A0A016TSP9_9BILA|nr:hypothetical protein Y032_0080g1378 [Ancylostoma ceylanicum]
MGYHFVEHSLLHWLATFYVQATFLLLSSNPRKSLGQILANEYILIQARKPHQKWADLNGKELAERGRNGL